MLLPGLIDDVATGTIFVQCVLALVLAADLMMWRSTAARLVVSRGNIRIIK
jgi:hypothetical protein